jgi:ParB-like chromosome segregation protein Spo0J
MGLLTDKENGLLNEASLAEAKKAKIVYLDLDEINMYDGNIGEPTEQEINYRMENIQEVGLLQPLLVMKTGNRIVLNTGHKRFLAIKRLTEEGKSYKYLGKELFGQVPCQFLDSLAENEMFDVIAICSNAYHADSKEEKRQKVWRLHRIYKWLIERNKKPEGREREWISSMTGISDGTVKNLLAEFNSREVQTEELPVPEEKPKDMNREITGKLDRMNKYLSKVDLDTLTPLERQNLNELLRSVQETLEELIYSDSNAG